MSKLFIIGNGFDLAHGLPTSYNHFRDYLFRTYEVPPQCTQVRFYQEVPTPGVDQDGGPLIDHSDNVEFVISMISEGIRSVTEERYEGEEDLNWCFFESALGKLPFQDCFEDTEGYVRDEGEDIPHYGRTLENQELRSDEIKIAISELNNYFRNWIQGINRMISNETQANVRFRELFEIESTLFLTFNYTDTLEVIYQIPEERICHIHGQVSKPDREIIFGHGNMPLEREEIDEEEYQEDIVGDCCENLTNQFRKDIENCLAEQEDFFIEIEEMEEPVREIYSYGFSFSDVDKPYIERICQILPTENITWYLNIRNENENEEEKSRRECENHKDKLRDAGFLGRCEEYYSIL